MLRLRAAAPPRPRLLHHRRARLSPRAGAAPLPPPRPEVARAAAACLAPLLLDAGSEPAAAVRRALRAGSGRGAQSGPALDNDDRSALSRLVLGAAVLRAQLAHQAAAALGSLGADATSAAAALRAGAAAGEPAAPRAEPLREAAALDAARVLLALYMLHGSGADAQHAEADENDAAAIEDALLALELPPVALAALRSASPAAVTWPAGAAGLAARRSLPLWLADELRTTYGAAHADALGAALSTPGPVTLRVNALRGATRADVAAELAGAGVVTEPGAHAPTALRLPRGRPRLGLLHLPGWADGRWEVQDEGSQLLCAALRCAPGEAVLDLCAGNGGKSLALAAAVGPAGAVLSYDVAAHRLAALRASSKRAGADGIIATADSPQALLAAAADVAATRGGLAAALVDAPCSGVGALRRRPGDRWALRRTDAVDAAPALQRALLSLAAALLLRCGAARARLVYATCSLLRQENDDVADWFTAAYAADFEPWPLDEADGAFARTRPPPELARCAAPHTRTLLPHLHGTDGFYVARWRRRG